MDDHPVTPDAEPPIVGLPPREESAPPPTAHDLMGGRLLNIFGLVSPVANVAMLQFSPPEMRWMGIGAGVILWGLGGWAAVADVVWVNRLAFGLHYALVLLGLLNPRWPEIPFGGWIRFGKLLGAIFIYPVFTAIYFLAVTPLALCMRIAGKDPLRRQAPPGESYWEDHETRDPDRFHRQF